jgi:hypothetical protein
MDDETLLVIPNEGVWYYLDNGNLTAASNTATLKQTAFATEALYLGDRTVALALQSGSLFIVDLSTGEREAIPVAQGYLSGLARAITGEILIADDEGFYAIAWPAHWRIGELATQISDWWAQPQPYVECLQVFSC